MLREFSARLQYLLRRRNAYRTVFEDKDGKMKIHAEVVLADLSRFCGYQKSSVRATPTGKIDPLEIAMREGRREVFLRILSHLHSTDEDIRAALEAESVGPADRSHFEEN